MTEKGGGHMGMLTYMSDNIELTENDSVLLNVIKSKPNLVLTLSIREFAKESFVSPSAVVRFYKKLGFSTYQGFLIELAKETEHHLDFSNKVNASFPFSYHDKEKDITKQIADLSCEAIKKTSLLINEISLRQATDLIMEANSIYGIGVSHSFNRMMDFQTKMLRIHKFVKVMPLQSDQYHLANDARCGDVVIIVSYSDTTTELINYAKAFKKKGAHVISITSSQRGELAELSTVVLPLPSLENSETNISSFASQTATEYVLNTLYSCVYNRDYEYHINNIKNETLTFFN